MADVFDFEIRNNKVHVICNSVFNYIQCIESATA